MTTKTTEKVEETQVLEQPPVVEQPPLPLKEEFQVSGEAMLAKVRELVHEGNVRRIILKNEDGHIVAEFPLSLGVVGVVLVPVWAAIGAIAALAANFTIEVERKETTPI